MIFFLFFLTNVAVAKRLPPPVIKPINHQGYSYSIEVSGDQQVHQVSLVARAQRKQVEQWRAPLYRTIYKDNLEQDVQQVFVQSLTLDKDLLIATDERGRRYEVNIRTGQMPKAYLISGFDDVLRQAENTGLIKAGLKLFEPDRGFAGMRELYMLLTNEEANPRFVLVSAIATWFEKRITTFLSESRYPSVELKLRNWLTEFSIQTFKMNRVAEVIQKNPGRRFIIVFDNSGASLQLAQRLLQEYPTTIQAFYLREVEKKDHPAGTIPFHTAFDIAVHEVKARRLSDKEAIVIGHALLEEKHGENIIPHYAYCPKDYSPCQGIVGDLVKVCGLVEERIHQVCRKR